MVAALWDRMCREIVDGGPLTDRGRGLISRMLAMSAWHRNAFCLVALDGEQIIGFANGRVDIGDGLLPGAAGELESVYVVPEAHGRGVSVALAGAAVAHLRGLGASIIRTNVCAENDEARRFWQDLGFEADMVVLSLYEDG